MRSIDRAMVMMHSLTALLFVLGIAGAAGAQSKK
jgi:hypothetical protein